MRQIVNKMEFLNFSVGHASNNLAPTPGVGARLEGYMTKRVGVLVVGCGHLDGAEIHETTCTLLALDQAGAEIVGISIDRNQTAVINHSNNRQVGESRNMLVEAARVMRGNVLSITSVKTEDIDALIIPGGSGGVARNLSNYMQAGRNCEVDREVKRLVTDCAKAGKPVGAICIAPVLLAKIFEGSGIKPVLTIGNDTKVASDIEAMGALHKACAVDEVVVDRENKIVTTPAYMLATRISQANAGIMKLVAEVLKMA